MGKKEYVIRKERNGKEENKSEGVECNRTERK